ncbi:amidohydrolase family protein [Novosphingobium mathurense]|uniref:Aminocarboxymuconate-semialdehyde decarboxylase n=1 Tax=Novosphingobium mathurense TaxID=428990 RepID=A0A1U6ILR5_9SPHN|nr:amidohydrolase family protein [Novosphingobium mathurense]SLK08956.1 aminocarboxymuconate-semialdehyde decarboxylase [Novosphingobium mathurense]
MGTGHNHSAHQPIVVRQRGKHLVVDIHAHLNVVAAEEAVRQAIPDLPRGLPFSCPASDAVNGRMFAQIGSRLNGVAERIEDMDRLGVDVQSLSPNPGQYYYFAPPELGRELARTINDGIAEAVAAVPDRLVGLGTVPLQDVDLAITEMRRVVHDCGMRGIEIGTNVGGRDFSDPAFRPFFAAAEELGILLFMHPLGFTQGERLSDHYLNNLIGNPLESTIALSHLIFGGVLDSHPGLKLCVAHGGGYVPAYSGRMDHAFRAREDCRQLIAREPSSYLKQIWFDSLVFDRGQLNHLIATYGADHVCLGSDYPFDMAEPDPVGFVSQLDNDKRARVLGLNAAELLSLTTGEDN